MDTKIHCELCATRTSEAGQHGTMYRLSDPTICSKCETDWGNNELPKVGGLPYCNPCREPLYHYPFPTWLQIGLAVSLLLLVVALAHGTRYFQLGRDLYRGERQLSRRQYTDAIKSLSPVAAAAPDCQKCVLLLAKAYLLSGQPEPAFQVAQKHRNGDFEPDELFNEVKPLFDRANTAEKELESAQKLYGEHKEDEALEVVKKAEHDYPEWTILSQAAKALQAGVAFDRHDYDQFLSLSEETYKSEPKSHMNSASLASALACKYASTGDPKFRAASEQLLAEARGLATTKDDQAEFQEYAERIEHRLKTREIITQEEYDRRYRPNAKPAEPAK